MGERHDDRADAGAVRSRSSVAGSVPEGTVSDRENRAQLHISICAQVDTIGRIMSSAPVEMRPRRSRHGGGPIDAEESCREARARLVPSTFTSVALADADGEAGGKGSPRSAITPLRRSILCRAPDDVERSRRPSGARHGDGPPRGAERNASRGDRGLPRQPLSPAIGDVHAVRERHGAGARVDGRPGPQFPLGRRGAAGWRRRSGPPPCVELRRGARVSAGALRRGPPRHRAVRDRAVGERG